MRKVLFVSPSQPRKVLPSKRRTGLSAAKEDRTTENNAKTQRRKGAKIFMKRRLPQRGTKRHKKECSCTGRLEEQQVNSDQNEEAAEGTFEVVGMTDLLDQPGANVTANDCGGS